MTVHHAREDLQLPLPLTTKYIVAKQDAAVQLSKRGGQLRDIDQLIVAAHASVKEDEEVDGVSVMQEDEEDPVSSLLPT